MPTLLNQEDVPAELLDRIRRSAAAHHRPFEDEVVWLLDRALTLPLLPPNPAAPATEDDVLSIGMLPLPGPSRQIDPLPGGNLPPMPLTPPDDEA